MPFTELYFAEHIYDRENPVFDCSRSKYYGFNWRGARRKLETDNGIADGGTGIKTENDHFLVGVIRQLLLKRSDGAWRGREEKDRGGWNWAESGERDAMPPSKVVEVGGALFGWLGVCGLKVQTLVSEVCRGDGAAAGEKKIVLKYFKEDAASDALSCACEVEDELPNKCGKNRIVREGGDDVLFSSL